MMVFDNLERFSWVSDINEHDLSKTVSNENILTSSWVNLDDCDCISLELFSFFCKAVVRLLCLPVIHPENSERVTYYDEVLA